MPDLAFAIKGVEADERSVAPFLNFRLEISSADPAVQFKGILLRVQIQIESARRRYSPPEKERLREIFGLPAEWGQTLRNKLWTQVDATIPAFEGRTEVRLAVPCTYDLNVLAAKYFNALEGGEAPLLFLFSGTIFHAGADGRLQAQPISWDKECVYRLPVQTWRDLMDELFLGTGWISVEKELFQRLCDYRRRRGHPTWNETIEDLLGVETPEAEARA